MDYDSWLEAFAPEHQAWRDLQLDLYVRRPRPTLSAAQTALVWVTSITKQTCARTATRFFLRLQGEESRTRWQPTVIRSSRRAADYAPISRIEVGSIDVVTGIGLAILGVIHEIGVSLIAQGVVLEIERRRAPDATPSQSLLLKETVEDVESTTYEVAPRGYRITRVHTVDREIRIEAE